MAGSLAIGLVSALAHSGASGIVKQRMDAMSDVARHMKAIGQMMKGEATFDASRVKASAERIAEHAGRISHLFPEGSNGKPSEALSVIWSDWDAFVTIAGDMETSAAALANAVDAAEDVDAIRPGFAALGQSCQSCHSRFRIPQ